MFATIQVSLKNGGGGYQILFGSAICSFLMFIILLYQKRNAWTFLEVIITLLIFVSASVWIIIGPYEAVALGIISESIVGIYLIIKTIQKPVIKYNLAGYSLFLLASIIATIDAKDWSLPEVGYSLSEVFITSVTIIPLIIKLFKENK